MEDIIPVVRLITTLLLCIAAPIFLIDLLLGRNEKFKTVRLIVSMCAVAIIYYFLVGRYPLPGNLLSLLYVTPLYGLTVGLILARLIQLRFVGNFSTISNTYSLFLQLSALLAPFITLFLFVFTIYIFSIGSYAIFSILMAPILMLALGIPALLVASTYALLVNLSDLFPNRNSLILTLLFVVVSTGLYGLVNIISQYLSRIIF